MNFTVGGDIKIVNSSSGYSKYFRLICAVPAWLYDQLTPLGVPHITIVSPPSILPTNYLSPFLHYSSESFLRLSLYSTVIFAYIDFMSVNPQIYTQKFQCHSTSYQIFILLQSLVLRHYVYNFKGCNKLYHVKNTRITLEVQDIASDSVIKGKYKLL